jgi:hypothetical protein
VPKHSFPCLYTNYPRGGRPGDVQPGHDGVPEDGAMGLLVESVVTQGWRVGGHGFCRSYQARTWKEPQREGEVVTGGQACGLNRPG